MLSFLLREADSAHVQVASGLTQQQEGFPGSPGERFPGSPWEGFPGSPRVTIGFSIRKRQRGWREKLPPQPERLT